MGKVLQELGIDITKMSAPEVQEKLLAIKNQLETSFRDAIADIENRVYEAVPDYYKEIDSYRMQIEKAEKAIEDYNNRIQALRDERSNHVVIRNNSEDAIRDVERMIDSVPAVIELRKQMKRTKDRYDEYTKLLDREVKRLTSEYVRMDLVNSLKSMKQIENKVKK